MMRAFIPLFALIVAALSAGCASDMPRVPERVNVPTPVPCVSELPKRPRLRTQTELFVMDRFTRTLAVWSDRLALDAYTRELEAVLAGCARLPARSQG